MCAMKLISFDIEADFGFFRKPDTNNTINLSYNIIHKPALLGILGAIIGLEGYKNKGKWPEYYEKLKSLQIGVEPLRHNKGNYLKTAIKYSNTIGYANKGTNFLTEELTLIAPHYRIYLLLDDDNDLHQKLFTYLSEAKAEYIPYFGKNEFSAWWDKDSFKEYDFEEITTEMEESVRVKTVFKKTGVLKEHQAEPDLGFLDSGNLKKSFLYFERLPKGFNLELAQYEMDEFVYSSYPIKNSFSLPNLYKLKDSDEYVQLL